MRTPACAEAGIPLKDKFSKNQLQVIKPILARMYREQYGQNYHAFYAFSPGSSHSKILVLIYPDFLRLVITSCNLMDIDTIGGDNHWYIHDLPKRPSRATPEPSSFEADFLEHLRALDTPVTFLNSIQGMYDYSQVKVHLVTSVPGVCAGSKAENHGLLRLRRIVRTLGLKLSKLEKPELRLEICAASIGKLSAQWLNDFNDCALGKPIVGVPEYVVPVLKLFYPSVGDVKKADPDAKEAASNIGCHLRPWDSAPTEVKNIFHHYESKDTGRLFHQKLILVYNPQDSSAPPYYVYVGSANFSSAAWGQLDEDLKKNRATCNTKLIKTSNFECGVVVPGSLIEGLLETGTESWQTGIVPYVQTTERYDLSKDRAWNSMCLFHIDSDFILRASIVLIIVRSGMGQELPRGLPRALNVPLGAAHSQSEHMYRLFGKLIVTPVDQGISERKDIMRLCFTDMRSFLHFVTNKICAPTYDFLTSRRSLFPFIVLLDWP